MEVKLDLDNRQPGKIRLMYYLTQKFVSGLFRLLTGLRVEGRSNVPAEGAFYLASNHQSWFDPPLIGANCPREIFYAAKLELFKTPVLGILVKYYNSLPVRRDGFDRALMKHAGEVIKAGFGLILFPEGTRHHDGKLHTPRAGIGMLSMKYNAPIVPVYVSGTSAIGKKFFCRGVRIKYGKPFTLDELGIGDLKGKEAYQKIAFGVMNRIAELGGVQPPQ